MKTNFTSNEFQVLVEQLEHVFETIVLLPVDAAKGGVGEQDGLVLNCALDELPACCVVSRVVCVDGAAYELRMGGALAGAAQAQQNMTERELQIYQDDLIRDFLSGTRNKRYWQTVFCKEMAEDIAAGKPVSMALISIDGFAALEQEHGALDADQLICYVANQWKKYYDEGSQKVVCRISQSTFAVGCVGAQLLDLESQMRFLYEKMNLVCTSTCGMLCRIPFTLSIACAGTDELEVPTAPVLEALCAQRLEAFAAQGGNGVASAATV